MLMAVTLAASLPCRPSPVCSAAAAVAWLGTVHRLCLEPLMLIGTEVSHHFPLEIPMALKSLIVFALLLAFALPARSDDDKDSKSLDGTWIPEAAEIAGQKFPDEVRKSIKLVVKGDKYTVTVGKETDEGTVKLKTTAKPKELDITGTDGPNKGKTILAIYELDGDTLKVCYDLGGKDRPTEFKTKEGSQQFLVTYKREKK
jgi:uncharacterized protein (TIGR03067 family)